MARPKGSGLIYDPVKHKAAVLKWIAAGGMLTEYCRQEGAPDRDLIYRWREQDADFDRQFARARDIGADAIAEEAMRILDEPAELIENEGGSRRDAAHVAWQRNRAEYRLKLLAKWNPKRYGDRTTISGDPERPVVTEVVYRWATPQEIRGRVIDVEPE